MNKRAAGAVITLGAATVLFLGAVHYTMPAKRLENKSPLEGTRQKLDTTGEENIREAEAVLDGDGKVSGYVVTVEEEGYHGEILMEVTVDAEAVQVLGVNIKQQTETEGLGAGIAEEAFYGQFVNVSAPVYLEGSAVEAEQDGEAVWAGLQDGTYTASTGEFANGYMDTLELTVTDGQVTDLFWDSEDEEGNTKRVLSETGAYTMTEDGLTWKEQADALAEAVIENQSLEFLGADEAGKTDAVTGVSISVGGFENLVLQCLMEAAGQADETSAAAERQGTAIDGISGATISSTAVVNGVNRVMSFLQSK